jgi:hypothetical protein
MNPCGKFPRINQGKVDDVGSGPCGMGNSQRMQARCVCKLVFVRWFAEEVSHRRDLTKVNKDSILNIIKRIHKVSPTIIKI